MKTEHIGTLFVNGRESRAKQRFQADQVNGALERRAKQRFRIDQEVRYKMLYGRRIAETGVGRTSNISSSGVWLTTETMLSSGTPVELSMHWPLLLNETCPMKLMIYGCVVRSNERGAAIAIERYEFRTQGSLPAQRGAIAAPMEDHDFG